MKIKYSPIVTIFLLLFIGANVNAQVMPFGMINAEKASGISYRDTETEIVEVTSATGRIWMDRNLGATRAATSDTDYLAYGDLYQWGRGADGHQTIVWTSSSTSNGVEQNNETSTLATSNTPGHGNYILAPNSPYDWRSPQDNFLWNSNEPENSNDPAPVKGPTDPCPEGYRVPTAGEWEAEMLSWTNENAAGAFASNLKLAVASYRNISDGLLKIDPSRTVGRYWSSSASGATSGILALGYLSASIQIRDRAFGMCVRCIKEATVPNEPTIGTAIGGDAQATVTFTAPVSDGGAAITTYTVTSFPSEITESGASSPITITGLTNGTAYTFSVTATNSVGTGTASAASNSVTPATVPFVTNPTTGKIWMDRNLGATQVATSSTDAASFGNLYQWGRGTDGHQIRTSGTTGVQSSSSSPGSTFITGSSNWYTGTDPDNLWQGVNGINNPCPSGYRLPTDAEWNAEWVIWSSIGADGAFASPLKLPMAGRRGTNGFINGNGTDGYYWSSTVSSTNSRNLYFINGDAAMDVSNRAYGFAVRCIKD